MADIAKAKRNVAKMVSQNAPESDIDAYIQSEGLTIDQIRNFKEVDDGKTSEPTGAVRDPNPVVNLGRDVYDAAKSGIEKIGNAFRPYQTYPITQDPIGRGVEGGGRFGEAIIGLSEIASSPFAPIMKPLSPILTPLDELQDKLVESQQWFPPLKAIATAKGIPEVAETAKEINKLAGQTAAGVALGGVKLKTNTTRNIAKGKQLYNLSTPAISKELTRPSDLNKMIPYLKESQAKSPVKYKYKDIENSTVRQVAQEKYPEIKNKIYGERDSFIERHKDAPVINFGARVGSAVDDLRNILTKTKDILKDQSIIAEVDSWKNIGQVTLREASEYLRKLNDQLHDFYKRSDEVRVASEGKADPIAVTEKAADKIRDIITDELKDLGENANQYKKLSEDYGAAARLEAAAERNIVSSEKPVPPFLSRMGERLSTAGKGSVVTSIDPLLRWHNQSAYMNRALNKFAKQDKTLAPIGVPFFALPARDKKKK